ncbi:H(+)/Cl(-) exchange transporter ClcA [anaerobic digester metagenome]
MTNINNYQKAIQLHSRKLPLVLKSIVVGFSVSMVVILYRLVLSQAEEWSLLIYGYFRDRTAQIPILFLILGLTGWGIGKLVRQYPMISGSGIPQVRGQLMGYFENQWLSTLLAKFFGGAVSILAGLSVGREGPSIQLGSSVAQGLGSRLSATRTEQKILIASGAGAGLATAFNAPLAGVMFALEEIFRYFSPVILLATILSAIAGDYLSKVIFGLDPVFHFSISGSMPLNLYGILLILGVVVGLAGALYNFVLIHTIGLYHKVARFNVHLKTIIPFLVAGVVGLSFPMVLGGGEHIIKELNASRSLQWLILILLLKFLFSMISFGSGIPGGIFFPLLVIGSLIGAVFGHVAISAIGIDSELFYHFVVLAMAGFFTAIVRAPITGIILLTEMTGSFQHLLPLAVVSIIAYLTADLVKSTPIYESLLELQLRNREENSCEEPECRKIIVETMVHHGSWLEDKKIKDIGLSTGNLVIAIRREGMDLTPGGMTTIQAEDMLIVLTDIRQEKDVREMLRKWAEN